MSTKYYCITAHTPFVGENQDFFYKGKKDTPEFFQFVDECVQENASEWADTETFYHFDSEQEYLDNCFYTIREISKNEYKEGKGEK